MGGEEFAVMAATAGPQQGFMLAERLRKSVEEHLFHWQPTLRLTVSIGVSSGKVLSGSLTEAFNKLLAEADEYLYRSKKAGRNCASMRRRQSKNIKILSRFLTAVACSTARISIVRR
jgi:diguanylate cyclase (GGDEF)-like protein